MVLNTKFILNTKCKLFSSPGALKSGFPTDSENAIPMTHNNTKTNQRLSLIMWTLVLKRQKLVYLQDLNASQTPDFGSMYYIKPGESETGRQCPAGTSVPPRRQAESPAGEEKVDCPLGLTALGIHWVHVIYREAVVEIL